MKEFGSDFHYVDFKESLNEISFAETSVFFGCGRYAITHLVKYHLDIGEWKNIFIPEYFCYEVINSIRSIGIGIKFYRDYPLADDEYILSKITFEEGDVLLRMNYFGMRGFRDNSRIPIPVIEDHSHNLFSNWAKNSNADWCVASLRKTLPIPDGGILWSPKEDKLITLPLFTDDHLQNVNERFDAMVMKSGYLNGRGNVEKDVFLNKFGETERCFGTNDISSISKLSWDLLKKIPRDIDEIKFKNLDILIDLLDKRNVSIVNQDYCENPFSLILLFNSRDDRNLVREYLIKNNIYPAILWTIDNHNASKEVISFSERMLSVHIDFRYSDEDIVDMSKIINKGIQKLSYEI